MPVRLTAVTHLEAWMTQGAGLEAQRSQRMLFDLAAERLVSSPQQRCRVGAGARTTLPYARPTGLSIVPVSCIPRLR